MDKPFFYAKNTGGRVETKGINSCFLGHKLPASSVDKKNGIYAEWLWDGQKLIVNNDRFGFYPLYYCHYNNQIIISPSIKTLLKQGAPYELDYTALSVFLRAGFYISNDTPFKFIKILPPDANFIWEHNNLIVHGKYDDKDSMKILNISENDAIDQYILLFRQSMERRLPKNDNFTVPLSAGRDSRHIILELDHLGYKPKLSVTVRPYSFLYDEDVQPAKILSDALGINHLFIDQGGLNFNNEIRNLELTNYCADENSWSLPLADYLNKNKIETIYDGIAGDIFTFPGYGWERELVESLRHQNYIKFSKILFKSWQKPDDYTLKKILDKDFYNKVSLDCAIEHLTNEAKKHIEYPNPRRSFHFWNRARREIALAPYAIYSNVPNVYSPYLDCDLYDFVKTLPEYLNDEKTLHTKIIERAYSKYNFVPYEIPFKDNQDEYMRNTFNHRYFFTVDLAKYFLKNLIISSQFLKMNFLFPRSMRCLIDKDYYKSFWKVNPPTMLYLTELEKLQRGKAYGL